MNKSFLKPIIGLSFGLALFMSSTTLATGNTQGPVNPSAIEVKTNEDLDKDLGRGTNWWALITNNYALAGSN